MKYLKLFGFFVIYSLFLFSGCESVDGAQKAADSFFEAYNNVDEKKMDNILDKESVIDAGIKNDFYDVFSKHQEAFGKITNYERYGFSTKSDDGLTTVTLKFKCETEQGTTVYEKLKFVKRGDEYKVYEYVFNTVQSETDKE